MDFVYKGSEKWILSILSVFMMLSLLFSVPVHAATIEINETNFPDEAFRTYLSDTYGDSFDPTDVESLGLQDLGIEDLTGIEYFTNLLILNCSDNSLTEVDLSSNTTLESLTLDNNELTSLDVSYLTNLEELSFMSNSISEIDLSNNTALIALICDDNDLTSLDLSNNPNLYILYCELCSLTSIDLTNCTALQTLACSTNNLTELDLSDCTSLAYLYCEYSGIDELDVSMCSDLKYLYCGDNEGLTSIDISNNTALTIFSCTRDSITSLDVSNNTALTTLDVSYNNILCLDLSNNTNLTDVTLYGQEINIDVTSTDSYDLSDYDANVDASCITDVSGATLDGTVLTDFTSDEEITFTYTTDYGDISVSMYLTYVEVPITDITLDETELSLDIDTTSTLTATIEPEDTNQDTTITWTSSDESIATVDDGEITAVAVGTAIITATTTNDLSATCEVTVTSPITGISLDETSLELEKDDTTTLTATIEPEDTTDDTTITWSSSDESIVTVEDGELTGIDAGTATITATTSNDLTATCEVTVTIPITSITLSETSLELEKGDTSSLTATIDPEDTTDDTTITWQSSDEDVATVEDGKITAVAGGSATITATTSNDLTATCEVIVTSAITGISLDETTLELEKDDSATLTATIEPEDTTDDTTITWSSSDESVVTVDEGEVTAIGAGTATITATTSNDLTATCEVAVTIPITSITLNETSLSLEIGDTSTLTATIEPTDTTDDTTITWESSDESIATVEDGFVTAIASGTTTITATSSNDISITCEVTVLYDLSSAIVTINGEYTYSGEAIEADIEVTYNDMILIEDTDYTLSYSNNINAGEATVEIVGIGDYTATITKTFTIDQKDVSSLTYPTIDNQVYTGEAFEPTVLIKNDTTALWRNQDYTLTYENNIDPGKASIILEGMGNYTGTYTVYFYIVPTSVEIIDASSTMDTITLTWSEAYNAEGYEIAYAIDDEYELLDIETNIVTATIENLLDDTIYNIKIRAYIIDDGDKIYGDYSDIYSIATIEDTHKEIGEKIARIAISKIGCDYVKGGSGSDEFDSAGLIVYCHKEAEVEISIKQNPADIATLGEEVEIDDIQKGDTIIYANNSCGIYVGDGKVVIASSRMYGEVIQTTLENYDKIVRLY